MPIRATFTGDVTDLRRGTQQAREEFRKVGTEAQGAARQLKAVGSSFDGSKLEGSAQRVARGIERLGGASRLTDNELTRNSRIITEVLQKYERMGVEAPAHIRRVASELRSAQAAARELDTATSRLGSLGRGGGALLSGLGIGVGAGAGLGAITAIGAAIADMASDGARMAPLAQAFERLQGGAGNAFIELQKLRTATRGLVSDADLMRQSNQATQLQLTAMGVDMGKLAGAAVRLGAAVGNDATTSIDNLIGALGRGSTEVLDNLGITLKVAEAQELYADRLGKTTAQLTDQEKKQAFVTIGLERAIDAANRLGEQQLTTAQQAERIATAIGDMGASMFSAGNQSVTLAGQLGEVADVLERIRNARPGDIGNVIATELSRAGARLREASEQAVNNAPWYLRALAETGTAPARLAGAAAGLAAPYFGTTNFQALPGNPLAATIPAMSAPGAAAGIGSVVDINAIREAVQRLTAAQREAIKEAKALGASNKEAANAAGTTENVVRAFIAMESGAKKATVATNKLREEFEKLTGQQAQQDAAKLAEAVIAFAEEGGQIPSDKVEAVAKQLMAARKAAFEAGEETIRFRQALDTLVIPSKRIDGFLRADTNLQNSISGAARNAILQAQRATQLAGFGTDIIASSNPFAGRIVGLPEAATVSPYTLEMIRRAHNQTKDWRLEVRGVAQAFAQLAQIAGPSLNGVARGVGTAFASVDAANELVNSLAGALPKLGLTTVNERGETVLSGRGRAIAGGMAAFTTGAQLGSMTSNPILGGVLGAGGGVASGAMMGITSAAGLAGMGAIGAAAAIYMAWRNRQAEKKALSEQRAQVIASAGGYEEFRKAVERAGFEFDYFLTKFNSNDADVFTEGMNQLNVALAEQTTRASKLSKSLNEVARVHGVLSQQQIAQIRNMQAGDPGAEDVLAFAEQQRQAGEAGIVSAAGALAQMASLTQEELAELTEGITDAAERQRVIDAELKRRAVDTMNRFGGSVQATASGLFVAFTEAVRQGESAIDVLRRLEPSIKTIQDLYKRAGLTPGAGFQQLQFQAGMVSNPQTGPALQLAQGLGQALSAYANTGLLSPELFGELANGIGQAYKQLELLGKGGLEAARLMQPSLQAIWQMIQDNPALRGELDDTTLALLDFAEQAGLIGEEFRPAIDRMIDGINDLIEKLNEFIDRIGQIPGVPPLETGGGGEGEGGGGDTGGGDGGGNGTGGNQGGEYDDPIRETSALRLGGAPGDVIPLSSRTGAGAPLQITVVSNIDGYEAARAVTRHQPAVYRQYGAA